MLRPDLFERSPTDRMLTGVCGGLGARIGVEPAALRLALVVLAVARGAGVVLYLALWLVSARAGGATTSGARAGEAAARPTGRRFIGLWLVIAGALVILREAALWPGDELMGALALGAFGSGLLWTRSEGRRFVIGRKRLPRGRLVAGAALVVSGMSIFIAANTSLAAVRNVVFAVVVTVAGLGLIAGPWIDQLVRQLRAERTERIRSQERAEVAAHLHDSVLQSLALIQRAETPQEMASLARVQERELRSWLYGRARDPGAPGQPVRLGDALEAMAARIERLHRIAVESVLVGDAELDDRTSALVDAVGEAVTNAAKHAGVARVSVYVEVDEAEVRAYVRDEGAGFDPAAPAGDRRGIAESIVGRMERNGGVATVRSAPREGTEVSLVLPRA